MKRSLADKRLFNVLQEAERDLQKEEDETIGAQDATRGEVLNRALCYVKRRKSWRGTPEVERALLYLVKENLERELFAVASALRILADRTEVAATNTPNA